LVYLLFSGGGKKTSFTLPPSTMYFMIFLLFTSVSLIGAQDVQFGLKFQMHQVILLITIVAAYNVFVREGIHYDFKSLEKS